MIPKNYVCLVGRQPKQIQKEAIIYDSAKPCIGDGAFSKVYRGFWRHREGGREVNREVALKIPKQPNHATQAREETIKG
jgi:hypothetical protein